MFGWLRRDKRLRELRASMDYLESSIKKKLDQVHEDMEVFKKVANLREYKKLNSPAYTSLLGWTIPHEDEFQKEREKARLEGFDFAYKYKSGDEIWVKYVEAK